MKKRINMEQFNQLKNNKENYNKKSENVQLVENAGKLKGLSKEEIRKQIEKVNLIEDMSTLGTIMKEEILIEKKTNPEKFYSTEEIIQQKSEDVQLYALGILSKILENNGTVNAIKKI